MNKPTVIRRLRLTPAHLPTGRTRHFSGGVPAPVPTELRIVKYADDPGYYLLHCDCDGKEITDTYHDALDGAVAQAAWEFSVKETEWEIITSIGEPAPGER